VPNRAKIFTPITIGAVAATTRWRGRLCTALWARPIGQAVPPLSALPRTFRRGCTPVRAWVGTADASAQTNLDPIPLLLRDGVLSVAVARRGDRG